MVRGLIVPFLFVGCLPNGGRRFLFYISMPIEVPTLALDLIAHFEGFSPVPYLCPAGIRTIGYGTTIHKDTPNRVTEEQARELMKKDAQDACNVVMFCVKPKLYTRQLAALTSFVYNVGAGNFERSMLLKKINGGNVIEIPQQINRWRYVNKVPNRGLIYRRMVESSLYIHGNDDKPLGDIYREAREYADKQEI